MTNDEEDNAIEQDEDEKTPKGWEKDVAEDVETWGKHVAEDVESSPNDALLKPSKICKGPVRRCECDDVRYHVLKKI